MDNQPSFAVVVPFFNEEKNVEMVCRELRETVGQPFSRFEFAFIDDGSKDATGALLDRLALDWPECQVYHLGRNAGQSAALLFGFGKTTAPVIITMDGDGQNDPRDIPQLLQRLEEADMVVGVRVNREDSWMRRKISRIANGVRAYWFQDAITDSGCALKVFRREVTDAFIPIRTLYSFMPALAVAAGFQVAEQPVNHRPRKHGRSRYTVRSFLLFPIIDFIGLAWFNSRRCNRRQRQVCALRPDEVASSSWRLLFQRWATVVSLLLIVGGLTFGFRHHASDARDLSARRLDLARAEQVALQRLHSGRFMAEELRQTKGHPMWELDVQLPHSADLTEIDIDALDGHVIAMREESPVEEARETAVENNPLQPFR